MQHEDENKPIIEKVSRECLNCNKNFIAPSKYIRLCDNCKKDKRFPNGHEDYSLHNKSDGL